MADRNDKPQDQNQTQRPSTPDDGPVQTRDTPQGASPDRQIAQEPQQSTGLGMGQS